MRSTDFEVEESRVAYVLNGRGTGHGAGLCQAGAVVRARRGETRNAILGLYYRGATHDPLLSAIEDTARINEWLRLRPFATVCRPSAVLGSVLP